MKVNDEILLHMDESNNEWMQEYIAEGDIETMGAVTGLSEETCLMVVNGVIGTVFIFNKLYLIESTNLIMH